MYEQGVSTNYNWYHNDLLRNHETQILELVHGHSKQHTYTVFFVFTDFFSMGENTRHAKDINSTL